MNMIFIDLRVMCLISVGLSNCYTFECDGPMRKIKKATDIQSTFLHDYLRYFYCQSDHGETTWQFYTSECLKNESCVGVRTRSPKVICTLSDSISDENVPIQDLWLEITAFEGRSQ